MRTAPLMKGEMIDLSHAPASMPAHVPLIELRDLRVVFPQKGGDIKAVRRVSISIAEQERVAILGESGCGKTMTAMSMLGLQPAEAKVTGRLSFRGRTVDMAASDDAAALVRNNAGAVFQDSLSSLNPTMRIGAQLVERLTLRRWDHKAAFAEAVRILQRVGVPDPQARMAAFPHELSGGMRQRVSLARTLSFEPRLLLMDEPFGALDSQTRELMQEEVQTIWLRTRQTVLLVTHDIDEAIYMADRVLVFSARPGMVKREFSVGFERPRRPDIRKAPDYAAIRNEIWDLLREEVMQARADRPS